MRVVFYLKLKSLCEVGTKHTTHTYWLNTDLVSPGTYPDIVSPSAWNPFVKKNKEFKTALITSFILLLIGVNSVTLMNITITIDKTHNIYDLIYAASTYMIL